MFSFVPRCHGGVRIGEVDTQSRLPLYPFVVEHLVALIPGQCAPESFRKHRERMDESITDDLGCPPAPDRDEDCEPGLAFDERGNG